MKQSKIFDEATRNLQQPFTEADVAEALESNSEWISKKEYIKSLLKDRVAKNMLLQTGDMYSINFTLPVKKESSNLGEKANDKFSWIVTSKNKTKFPIYPSAISDSSILSYLKMVGSPIHGTITVDENNLVELTQNNINIVEDMITRGIAPRLAKKYNSNAHRVYDNLVGANGFDFNNYNNVYSVVSQIDIDNGTMDSKLKTKYGSAVDYFTRYIVAHNSFERDLDGDVLTIKRLVDDMNHAFSGYNAKSLASKVCKYFHEYRYGNDKFFINDSVVRGVLPYYCDKYGIMKNNDIDNLSYSDLYDLLEQVYVHCPQGTTKTQFDHVLWYCYRGYNK